MIGGPARSAPAGCDDQEYGDDVSDGDDYSNDEFDVDDVYDGDLGRGHGEDVNVLTIIVMKG